MNNILTNVYVGVDVSKKHLDVHAHPVAKKKRFTNDQKGFEGLLHFFSSYQVEQIVCEASGGYEIKMVRFLQHNDYKIWVVEPRRIKGFILSEGIAIKTDASDAKMIALFASQKKCSYTPINRSGDNLHLNSLVKRKRDLTEIIAKEKTRLKNAQDQDDIYSQPSIKKVIKFFEKQIKEIEDNIEQLVANNEDFDKKAHILCSVPGIGKVTSAAIIAQLPELGKISGKQISSLVGVAPRVKQSGFYRGNAYTGGGRNELRHDVYMAALTASRSNPILSKFYQRLIAAGKKPKVALIAVIRKLMVIINAMIRNQEMWKIA